ncbi:2-hydroxychromene-2-carboxylate isomerase [Motiliproteus sediminis]|uniref:2-hydroxychromene-2-carboxylate isomerase n=1 Tax=Motiliproteus sediminis TaxID=1468178 RepID=UPI001AEF6A53
MHRTIEFYYDVLSPYAYLCFCRLPGLVKRSGAAMLLKPVSLPRLLEQSGNPPPLSVAAKADYLRRDTAELARYYGIPFEWPALHPQRTGRAMTVLSTLGEAERMELSRVLFEAMWIEGRDLGDPEVLETLVGSELLAAAETPQARELLQQGTLELIAKGGFGVPSLVVDDQLFFGNDRLFLVERALNG